MSRQQQLFGELRRAIKLNSILALNIERSISNSLLKNNRFCRVFTNSYCRCDKSAYALMILKNVHPAQYRLLTNGGLLAIMLAALSAVFPVIAISSR